MPKIIDHKKRKEDILSRALEVFADFGFERTNLQQIADRCGISRPTLYQYFKDKDDIFYFSIKQITDRMQRGYIKAALMDGMDTADKLQKILDQIVEQCYSDRSILKALLNFIRQANSQGLASDEAISRRTIKLRILIARILRNGIRKEELKLDNVDQTVQFIFTMLETFLIQMTNHEKIELSTFQKINRSFVDSLKI